MLWLRCQDPNWQGFLLFSPHRLRELEVGWDSSRFAVSCKFHEFVVKIPVGKFCRIVAKIPIGISRILWSWLGYFNCYGFVVKISYGIPKFLVLRWKNPGWVTSNFVVSWSRPRLEYFKFCCFMAKIPVGIPQVLWLRGLDIASFVASWSRSRLGYRKFCPFVVKIPLFFTSNFVASSSRYRLGHLKFWGFVGKIPVGIPQFLCLRKQEPG